MIHEEQKNTVLAGRCFSDELDFFQVTEKKLAVFFCQILGIRIVIYHMSHTHFSRALPKLETQVSGIQSITKELAL